METIKKMLKWVGIDGLLHFLVCYAMMLTFAPMIGLAWAVLATTGVAVLKEVWDFCIQKDNNEKQVMHDFVFDIVGILMAIVVLAV